MQLLELTHQNTAGANNIRHRVELQNPMQHFTRVHPDTEVVAPSRRTDCLARDDCEGVSLLDTPAPRKKPPVPTKYESEPVTAAYQPNGSSHQGNSGKLSSAQPGVQFHYVVCVTYCLACWQQKYM